MRWGVLLAVWLWATAAAAQTDGQSDEGSAGGVTPPSEVRNKTTAERIASPVPTTKGVPWSFPLFWDQSITIRSFNEGSQLTPSPNYTWWFAAAPRWLFSEVHSIGVTAGVSIEWTDSPGTDFERIGFESRQALWEDVRIDYLLSVPGRPGGFLFFVAADLRLPASKFSRARDRYFSPGIRGTVVRPVNVLAGMQFGLTAAFWGWFSGSNVVLAPEDLGGCRVAPGPGGGDTVDRCFGATTAIKHSTRLTAFWTFVPVDRLAIGLSYTAVWGRGDDLAVGCVETLTGRVCLDDGSPNNQWRTFSRFGASIGYDIKRWFTLALIFDTWAVQPNSDGGRENPFYNENSRIIFRLTLRTDGLYAATRDKRAQARSSAGVEEL